MNPTAVADNYTIVGNTQLRAGGPAGPPSAIAFTMDGEGVLTKGTDDSDPDGGILSVTGTQNVTNGTVNMNSNGTFSFIPTAGETSASFEYILSDGQGGSDTGMVTFAFLEEVWYLENDSTANGTGRSTDPFDTLGEAQTASSTGDHIFIHLGNGTDGGQNAGIVLKNNQKLIGHRASTVPVGSNTVQTPGNGNRPKINNTSGTAVSLAQSNTVTGLPIGNAPVNGKGINGTNVDTLTISDVTVSSTGAPGVDIAGGTGASVSLDGVTVTSSGTGGVLLSGNTGTFSFTGLSLTTTGGTGFSATNSGTVNVTGGTNTIDATGGTGVFIQDTNIGANDVTFASVSTNGLGGGTTGGIFVENTGTVAGSAFVVNGGTIQNAEGANLAADTVSTTGDGIGVYLEGVQNVTLSGLTVTNSQNFGIRGFDLTGTNVLTNVIVNSNHGNTAASDEAAVAFNRITGTLNVTNGSYGGGHEDTFSIRNTAGSVTATFSSVTINANNTTTGDNGLQFITSGNGTVGNLNVNGGTFNGARSVMLFVDIGGTGGGTVNVGNMTANSFTQNQMNLSSGGAIEVLATGTGNMSTVNSTISSNTILAGTNTFEGDVIVVGTGFGYDGTHNLTIQSNRVGTSGVNGSAVNPLASQGDNGLTLSANGEGTNALIDNNDIFDFNTEGIEVIFDGEGSSPPPPNAGTVNITITNNDVIDALGGTGAVDGIQVVGSDNVTACVAISFNTINNPAGLEIEIDLFETGGSGTYRVPGLTTLTEAGIDAFYTANNTLTAPGDVTVFGFVGYTIPGGGGACTMP